MEDRWIAWAAGLFEGEGCISQTVSFRGEKEYRYPVAKLAMIDEDTVRKFANIVKVGKISGPHGPYGISKQPQFLWQVYGYEKVQELLDQFTPFLGERRKLGFKTALAKPRGRVV